jgi:hypothetical protein
VRTEDGAGQSAQAYAPTPPRAASRASQPSATAPEGYYANAYASNNPYPAEAVEYETARRQGRKTGRMI